MIRTMESERQTPEYTKSNINTRQAIVHTYGHARLSRAHTNGNFFSVRVYFGDRSQTLVSVCDVLSLSHALGK